MPLLYADLHIHSCLSPCADDEMTPNNICGMAKLKGLDCIAVTDHNTALNLPAVQAVAEEMGLLLLPGMEITTREEVHLLGYFPDVAAALAVSGQIRAHLPKMKNRPDIFGHQYTLDADDNITGEEDAMLIGACDIALHDLCMMIRAAGGVPVPAHINRGSNGMLINQGFIPPDLSFTALEVSRALPCDEKAINGHLICHSSDAHYLGDVMEAEFQIAPKEKTVRSLLEYLKNG